MKLVNLAAITAIIAAAPAAAHEPLSYRDHMTLAGEAFQAENWVALNEQLDAAQEVRTYSLYVWRNRILARMLADRKEEAVALAETAARRGLILDLTGHPAFDALTALPEFAPIAERMKANAAPIGEANIILESESATLLPEAIAYGAENNAFIGSVRTGQILKVGESGETVEFVSAPGGVFDIEIHSGAMWVVANNQLAYENADPETPFAAVMAFDAETGEQKHDLRVVEDAALLGDLEIASDGTIYASDSTTPRLFRMNADDDALEVFAKDARFANLQGVALDEENDRIFLADYLTGLFIVDTNTGDVTPLQNTADAHLGGIDGLYLYDGGLIGIQNGTQPQRIVYMGLNDDASEIKSFKIMLQNLEEWNEPTHGAVVGDELRYIATSNWPSYDENWNVREGAELKPLRIMLLPLD